MRDDLAARLRVTFAEELDEQTSTLNEELLALERAPDEIDRVRAIFRIAHTLKGAARAVGERRIEALCHALEALLAEARDRRIELRQPHFALLFEAADALSAAGDQLRGTGSGHPAFEELERRLRAARGAPAIDAPSRALPPTGARESTRDADGGATAAGEVGRATRDDARHLRVQPEKLDALMASSGQLLISAGRAQSQAELLRELSDLVQRLQIEWRRGWRRVRTALDRADSGRELELLNPLGARIDHLLAEAARAAQGSGRDAARLWRVAGDIAEKVRGLRMRPFSDATEALPRLVRDLSTRTGKTLELIVEGEQIEADRAVLDGVREALIHLVRNAIDHGLETPADREAAGKPTEGKVRVAAELEGDGIRVIVSDDGAGLNVKALREQFARRGVPVPANDRELVQLLFEGGISTRETATEISGRGVGLDAVQSAVLRIRGDVSAHWRPGEGSTFTIHAPLSLTTLRVLLVRCGRYLLAIPTASVERLLHVPPAELRRVEGQSVLPSDEGPVPIASLAALLGPPLTVDEESDVMRVAIVRWGERRLALIVDELLTEQEIVLRPLERLGVPSVERIAGAALLPSGRVVLSVNVPALVRGGAVRSLAPVAAPRKPAAARRRILVVDDSITTRLLEQTVLESAGFEVITAVDGLEGWNLLQERGADLVVTDIEMPRMDGIEFCEAIRGSRRFERMPVVLVTSLESPEYRQRGLDAGADAYIVKSSFDQEALIETIEQLLR